MSRVPPTGGDAGRARRCVLIATRSAGKTRELRALLAESGYEAIDLNDMRVDVLPEEDALEVNETFEANALAKARHFHARTGVPTIADDSGLEVAALGGAPGVHSKRWSNRPDLDGTVLDEANNALLLERLGDGKDRRARYVCAAAYCGEGLEIVERGEVSGRITREARGSGGFGYDPYFFADELARTFAEVTIAEKATVSHRARAVAKLLRQLALAG